MKEFDAIIIGSGLIGSATAIALAQKSDQKIALTEWMPPAGKSEGHIYSTLDTRTLALNHASISYLSQLGLWRDLEQHACPIKKVHISEQSSFGSCILNAEDIHEDYLGQVIEIKDLQRSLIKALGKYPNIHILKNTKVLALEKQCEYWELKLSRQEKIETARTKQVILADGTKSTLREQLHISCNTFDYGQTAIVAVLSLAQAHQNIAYERFAGKYTLAILPLTANRVGTVLVLPTSEANDFLQLSDTEYMQKVQTHIAHRLGNFHGIGSRQSYPLYEVIASKFTLDNLVLLGNTAHTLNPLGAQGLNLGLAGVKNYVEHGCEKFETQQRARCERLKKFTRDTSKIFSSEAFPTCFARRTALFALQHCSTLKNKFTRRMMGF